jgi:hypothetical protein
MKATTKLLFMAALALPAASAIADPLLSTWMTENSGQYARIYLTKEAVLTGDAVSTWTGQTLPAYADVQKVEASANWVYINTTGLTSHSMGPWYLNTAKTTIFPNLPRNLNPTDRFPRVPSVPASKTGNYLSSLGRWVNGVGLFNMLDGAFYNNGAESQDGGQGVQTAYWVRNAMFVEVVTFDNSNGHQPPSGDYHYHAAPGGLRYQLGDNVSFNPGAGADNAGTYTENTTNLHHSPILGWSYDGFPVYGPYGYSDPAVSATETSVRRMRTGFTPRNGTLGTDNLAVTGRVALAKWSADMRGLTTTGTIYPITDTARRGPNVTSTYVIGYWCEDFAFLGNLGFIQGVDYDLDVHNGRFCRTPEFPQGTYAYFNTIDAAGQPAFPYVVGRQWYGSPTGGPVTSITETTAVIATGGPDAALEMATPVMDQAAGNISITWSSAEGGSYTLKSSSDLTNWNTVQTGITATDVTTQRAAALPTNASRQFYTVDRDSLAAYDATGSAGGGGPGGGEAVPGTGTPSTGYVFSFADGPPMQNLISNVVVRNAAGTISVPGTVRAYAVNGPQGGTVTISFNDASFVAGAYTARFTHTPPGVGTTTAISTNTYTKP